MSQDPNQCASRGCTRILIGTTVIVARDGRRFCKHHGDHLPRYLRKPQRPKKQKASA